MENKKGTGSRKRGKSVKATTRGLMIGRFQPFHNGHLALALQIMSECDEVVVVIGSAQFNFIEKDPFTAGERIAMVHNSLAEAGADLNRCYIVPIQNDENNSRWLANIKSMIPPFHAIYSGNDFVRHLAAEQDVEIEVRTPQFVRQAEYNGSVIRALIAAGNPWKEFVPAAVAEIIEQVNGVERIRMLSSADSLPQKW